MSADATAAGTIVVVNAGSTSLKVGWFDIGSLQRRWVGSFPLDATGDDVSTSISDEVEEALRASPVEWSNVAVVGHRIVHGGSVFSGPARIDPQVVATIRSLSTFAPLHNPIGLAGIAAAQRVAPLGAAHVAVFDTAFHSTLAPHASTYGGPKAWIDHGLRRYGFHGISHADAAQRAAHLLARPVGELAMVTCHLGGGCSLAAVDGGISIDTTMGLTPLDGLVMGTRSGSVDPALVLSLVRRAGSVDEVERVLEHESGLLGLSGVSGDLRAVIAARDAGQRDARLAVDVFVHRVTTAMGAMVAALGRLDAVVFTGGIGEHSAEVRQRTLRWLAPFGLHLDEARNEHVAGDAVVTAMGSAAAAVVVQAREDVAIARACTAFVT